MKKILILLVLCLGILGFSNEGFKNLKWGASKEEVIKVVGRNYVPEGNMIAYKNIEFGNLKLEMVGFNFVENKLVSWIGIGDYTSDDIYEIMSAFVEKYGKFTDSSIEEMKSTYYYISSKGTTSFTINAENSYKPSKLRLTIMYTSPNFLKDSKKNRENKLRNDL